MPKSWFASPPRKDSANNRAITRASAQLRINGDTALFEQIAREAGVFNRMLVYRRNSLHSGCIPKSFVPDANSATGRLSINSFIDIVSPVTADS